MQKSIPLRGRFVGDADDDQYLCCRKNELVSRDCLKVFGPPVTAENEAVQVEPGHPVGSLWNVQDFRLGFYIVQRRMVVAIAKRRDLDERCRQETWIG